MKLTNLSEARTICAWCKKDMGRPVGTIEDSHGICKLCDKKMRQQEDEYFEANPKDEGIASKDRYRELLDDFEE